MTGLGTVRQENFPGAIFRVLAFVSGIKMGVPTLVSLVLPM